MRNKVDFEFTKDWGSIKKGTVKNLKIAFAASLRDVHGVGKFKTAKKAVKPQANKVDKKAIQREVK